MARSKKQIGSAPKVEGFFRLNLVEDKDGEKVVVGDSGWQRNTVVNLGYSQYLVDLLCGGGSSKQVARMMLGTGTAPAVTDTTLHGELTSAAYTRQTVTTSNVSSKTARFTATWASANSHIGAQVTLQNIGIINNTTSAGTLMAGNTYTTSAWATNQDVNATYEIRFS